MVTIMIVILNKWRIWTVHTDLYWLHWFCIVHWIQPLFDQSSPQTLYTVFHQQNVHINWLNQGKLYTLNYLKGNQGKASTTGSINRKGRKNRHTTPPNSSAGWFSKADLHEWMPFIIFCTRSHKRLQLSLHGRFPSRRWLTLRVTMEAEPRIGKLYKCHHCCICKNYRGKVMKSDKKCLHCFSADQKVASACKKMHFGASYSTSNKSLLVARHILQKYL